ncbi:MAG TPA: hypothetical protein VFR02_03565 [bacterium]|nr:hypothetical protein [bacterium]
MQSDGEFETTLAVLDKPETHLRIRSASGSESTPTPTDERGKHDARNVLGMGRSPEDR